MLSRTTSYLQVYTVHSFLGESRIKEDPKPQKMLGKGAEVEREPALRLWVELTTPTSTGTAAASQKLT